MPRRQFSTLRPRPDPPTDFGTGWRAFYGRALQARISADDVTINAA
jgi:hypothetical protein